MNISNVATSTDEASCGSSDRRLNVCARYDGSSASSNMALVELSLISGYEANKQSLETLVVSSILFSHSFSAVNFSFEIEEGTEEDESKAI